MADEMNDEGTSAYGWGPLAHLEGAGAKANFQLRLEFWWERPGLDPRGCILVELEGEYRCRHCQFAIHSFNLGTAPKAGSVLGARAPAAMRGAARAARGVRAPGRAPRARALELVLDAYCARGSPRLLVGLAQLCAGARAPDARSRSARRGWR